MKPQNRQVGGDHYQIDGLQLHEFAALHELPPHVFCILRYIIRHEKKNGREDLEKAAHYAELYAEILTRPTWGLIPCPLLCIPKMGALKLAEAYRCKTVEKLLIADAVRFCSFRRQVRVIAFRGFAARVNAFTRDRYPVKTS